MEYKVWIIKILIYLGFLVVSLMLGLGSIIVDFVIGVIRRTQRALDGAKAAKKIK